MSKKNFLADVFACYASLCPQCAARNIASGDVIEPRFRNLMTVGLEKVHNVVLPHAEELVVCSDYEKALAKAKKVRTIALSIQKLIKVNFKEDYALDEILFCRSNSNQDVKNYNRFLGMLVYKYHIKRCDRKDMKTLQTIYAFALFITEHKVRGS